MEQGTEKPKRLRTALLCGSLAAVLAVPTMLAYLTDADTEVNKFSFADSLTVEVVEPSWETTDTDSDGVPDAAEDVVPTQTIAKDPSAKVTGADSYVWMEVKVPVALLETYGNSTPWTQQVFSFNVDLDNWSLVSEESTSSPTVSTDGYMTYLYKYIGGDNGVLADGATTEPVFEEVKLLNIVSNEGEAWTTEHSDIPVKAHAIQAEGFASADDAWAAYKAQNGL